MQDLRGVGIVADEAQHRRGGATVGLPDREDFAPFAGEGGEGTFDADQDAGEGLAGGVAFLGALGQSDFDVLPQVEVAGDGITAVVFDRDAWDFDQAPYLVTFRSSPATTSGW